MRTTNRARLLALAALVAPLALAACGSGEQGSSSPVPANPDLTVIAPGGLKFDKVEYTATAGDVAVAFENKDSQSHSLVVKKADDTQVGTRLLVAPGQAKGETLPLPAGQYKVICDVPGHAAGGMVATLTVS